QRGRGRTAPFFAPAIPKRRPSASDPSSVSGRPVCWATSSRTVLAVVENDLPLSSIMVVFLSCRIWLTKRSVRVRVTTPWVESLKADRCWFVLHEAADGLGYCCGEQYAVSVGAGCCDKTRAEVSY